MCSPEDSRKRALVPDEQPHDPVIDRVYADGVAMVQLLGPQDRLLLTIEQQFPLVDVMVRGNRITLDGEAKDVQAAKRLVEELVQLVRNDEELAAIDVTESARLLSEDADASPARVERLSHGSHLLPCRLGWVRPAAMGVLPCSARVDRPAGSVVSRRQRRGADGWPLQAVCYNV